MTTGHNVQQLLDLQNPYTCTEAEQTGRGATHSEARVLA